METTTITGRHTRVHRVLGIRNLCDSTYVLRFERNGLEFDPGQYLSVGRAGEIDRREYSVYSEPDRDYLEILVKEVEIGLVSRRLREVPEGGELSIEGPFGFFTIPEEERSSPFLFVSTGTGISPFHCFAGAYPDLDYRLLHGVRTSDEFYEHGAFDPARLVRCVSREASGDYGGRVTDYLRSHGVDPASMCYLCGNCDMIYEAFDILTTAGVPADRIFAEVYF